MEKFSSAVAYVFALLLAFIGALSPQDIAFYQLPDMAPAAQRETVQLWD
ncbi:hypothetical protein [Yersinia enterocolitica]|nr:hypothetical protein [Yersinia enterocolitica]MCG9217594.1 hypothetical protein [Yersinia enterocolitica]